MRGPSLQTLVEPKLIGTAWESLKCRRRPSHLRSSAPLDHQDGPSRVEMDRVSSKAGRGSGPSLPRPRRTFRVLVWLAGRWHLNRSFRQGAAAPAESQTDHLLLSFGRL